jgi:hypothetical protein
MECVLMHYMHDQVMASSLQDIRFSVPPSHTISGRAVAWGAYLSVSTGLWKLSFYGTVVHFAGNVCPEECRDQGWICPQMFECLCETLNVWDVSVITEC